MSKGHCEACLTDNHMALWNERHLRSTITAGIIAHCSYQFLTFMFCVSLSCEILFPPLSSANCLGFQTILTPASANRLMGVLYNGIICTISQSNCYFLSKTPSYDFLAVIMQELSLPSLHIGNIQVLRETDNASAVSFLFRFNTLNEKAYSLYLEL